jgi:hypothetical protein
MNTEATTLAPQTRQMLGEVAALTEGQGKDWLGKVMLKDEFMAVAQGYLNRAGLQRIEYSILMRFAAALERTLFTWRGQELAQRLEAQLCRWTSRGLDGVRMQKLAVHCWEWAKETGGAGQVRMQSAEVRSQAKSGTVLPAPSPLAGEGRGEGDSDSAVRHSTLGTRNCQEDAHEHEETQTPTEVRGSRNEE